MNWQLLYMCFMFAFLLLASVQHVRRRKQSAKSLATAFLIGFIQLAIMPLVNAQLEDQVLNGMSIGSAESISHLVVFLLAFGWLSILDHLKLRLSSLVCGLLVVIQFFVILDALISDGSASFVYSWYQYTITAINCLMLGAAFCEYDDICSCSTSSASDNKSRNDNKETAI